jgi:hypothetical protein
MNMIQLETARKIVTKDGSSTTTSYSYNAANQFGSIDLGKFKQKVKGKTSI